MTTYPSNISDSQWAIIAKFLDIKRSRKYDLREIINAIMYLVKTGCQWRMLPGDFPHWKIVYYYFSTWKKNGILEDIHQSLVEKVRKSVGKNEEPSVGIIDAQSVKNTLVSCEDKGFDAGKKVKGIKRHIIVDTLGLILAIVIQNASIQDRDGAQSVIEKMKENWLRVIKIFADGGYAGKLIDKIKLAFNIELEIIKRTDLYTFKVLPKRWIVERTFAWIDTNRRNSKNYERLNETSVAMVHLSAIRIMLNRF
ncbi:MAG: IS5 family transposase [Flavobacteriia bacterium]|nr:IS5 family transposase [Flavobacteriia bacterium]